MQDLREGNLSRPANSRIRAGASLARFSPSDPVHNVKPSREVVERLDAAQVLGVRSRCGGRPNSAWADHRDASPS